MPVCRRIHTFKTEYSQYLFYILGNNFLVLSCRSASKNSLRLLRKPALANKFARSICSTNLACLSNIHQNASILLPVLHTRRFSPPFRKSFRPISNSQLRTLLHFHLCPIYLMVFKGSHGYLILRGASRLDAFSVYPCRTWLLCHAPGGTTDTPAVRPPRSSRTKGSSSQISYARAG